MCVMLTNLLIFSPLEQFEINSFNSFLFYQTSFNSLIELFSIEYFYFLNKNIYSFFDLLILFIFIYSLQIFLKQKGFIYLFIFINLLTIGFN